MSTGTGPGIGREAALSLLTSHLSNRNLVSHSLASEAVMRALAKKFGEDEDVWGLAGLLHDIDYEQTADDPAAHAEVGAKLLSEKGVHPDIVEAVRMHNAEGLGLTRATRFAHALTCAESITGLIVATALVYPDKKLSSVKPKSVTKRFKTAHFARSVSRERIMECEAVGMDLAGFVALSLEAMTGIADELGL